MGYLSWSSHVTHAPPSGVFSDVPFEWEKAKTKNRNEDREKDRWLEGEGGGEEKKKSSDLPIRRDTLWQSIYSDRSLLERPFASRHLEGKPASKAEGGDWVGGSNRMG